MSKKRNYRVAEEIKREISAIIKTEVKDPRLAAGVISITGVKMTGDLSYAQISVSIYTKDQDTDAAEILETVRKCAGFIRMELGKRIRIRHIPQLLFQLDTSMEYGDHINKILKNLNYAKPGEKNEF